MRREAITLVTVMALSTLFVAACDKTPQADKNAPGASPPPASTPPASTPPAPATPAPSPSDSSKK